MKPLVKHILRVTVIVLVAVILGLVVWIMLNRIGLSDSLDFGAGAYYYADIPELDKIVNWDGYTARLPYWVYLVLFFAWGFIVWKLWKWIDRK